jgi:hypothetical protein
LYLIYLFELSDGVQDGRAIMDLKRAGTAPVWYEMRLMMISWTGWSIYVGILSHEMDGWIVLYVYDRRR